MADNWGDHARRRWRLRRQDHLLPGRDPVGSAVQDRRRPLRWRETEPSR
jgi:hypothetical protein